MTRTLAEILLFASVAINAALLIFIAGVLRKVMNDLNELAFKQLVTSLVIHSKKSPFMLIVLNIPLIGAIAYFYFYGFADRWLIAGLAVWLLAGALAKTIKLPVYKAIAALDVDNLTALREARHRLNAGNLLQAMLNSAAALLVLCQLVR